MSDTEFQRELQHIISVLSEKQRPAFENEKLMAFFQLKFWLNSNDDDFQSLRDGAALYAGSRIAERIRSVENPNRNTRPIEKFVNMADSEEIRALFDTWSNAQRSFARRGASSISPKYKDKTEIIYSVNHFVELCLRSEIERKTKIIQFAREQYKYDCDEDRRLFRDLDPRRKVLRTRLPFLYVARWKFKRLSSVPRKTEDLFEELEKCAGNAPYFKNYFAYCAHTQDVLRRGKELRGQLIASWAGTKPKRPAGLTPLRNEDVEAARRAHLAANKARAEEARQRKKI